ncbi:hypothetical protein [Herbaspirillum sp. ST 5-3]|uniref:hypothetical protein n=1 Tax=Oxalobacteraceae TaxID=75682 RepID=UPI0010A4A162|nr:hypothetical protein [Herbaspirillum sp. ST 5-3]
MALSALLWPRSAFPALPPASSGQSAESTESNAAPGKPAQLSPAAAADASAAEQAPGWVIPRVRLGGTISYDTRTDFGEGRKMQQRGLNATLRAATETYIWQPWLAQVGGNVNFSTAHNSNTKNQADFSSSSNSKNGVVTGSAQLRVLPQSRFPFEAHIERTDNRMASDSIPTVGFASQRIGFTQQYLRTDGDAYFGWDRSTQDSDTSGKDRQDNLQLTLSHNMETQRFQFSATRARNEHAMTGESTTQNNLSLQHSYTAIEDVSLETMANVSSSGYHLVQTENDTKLMQVSSIAFWRPEEMPLTLTGGVRMLALAADTGTFTTADTTISAAAKLRNANVNVGMSYDFGKFTHLNASANANHLDSNGSTAGTANESVGLTYQPQAIRFSSFQYNWSTTATATNQTGGNNTGRQLTLQLSHNLNRSFQLDGGSTITVELSQALSALASSGRQSTTFAPGSAATKQVTHGAAVSWSMSGDAGMAQLRLSASDSRSLDGNQDYFQMINFQASSNLSTSANTSWNGSLTVQAVRQGSNQPFLVAPIGTQPAGIYQGTTYDGQFKTTSSGALTYQNQRLFGVRRLRFVSDLRLNSEALLPMLGGPTDQEMAAWENRVDYWIGRTMLRVNTLVARTKVPFVKKTTDGVQEIASSTHLNKSIMFSVSRGFGDF